MSAAQRGFASSVKNGEANDALEGSLALHQGYGKSFRARMIRSTMCDPPLAPFVEAFDRQIEKL